MGDQLLIHLATAMKNTLREGDTLARLGGDEFVAMFVDLDSAETCVPMLTRLLDAVALPVPLGDIALQVSASIGVTFYPQAHEMEADQLLRQADQAMYQAKLSGRNHFHIFDPVQDSSIRVRHESLERVRAALEHREFVLHYQPKVNMQSGKVVGAEALIRWQHPLQGLLAPATFLPVIEDHKLAVEVGEWVGTLTSSGVLSHLRTVLRDIPVRLVISCSDSLSRTYIRRILPNISMVITFFAPAQKTGRTSKTPGSVLNRHNL